MRNIKTIHASPLRKYTGINSLKASTLAPVFPDRPYYIHIPYVCEYNITHTDNIIYSVGKKLRVPVAINTPFRRS